jgi:hypothetical protein
MDFDSFTVRFGGIRDDGMHKAVVIVGMSEKSGLNRGDIEIPVLFQASLDVSLRELREQAKVLALENLQKATKLLQEFSADQLHSKAQGAFAESKARHADDLQRALLDKLGETP